MPESDNKYSPVNLMVRECEEYRDELSKNRERAQEYYDGDMPDTPSDQGRSRVISRDVRSSIKKVLPSILRTILGNDEVVEFMPVGQNDEQSAEQASEFINYVVLPESKGHEAIHDAVHDAALYRNGILSWQYHKTTKVEFSSHTGLTPEQLAQFSSDDVEILEHTERTEQLETPEGLIDIPVHDVRIKRRVEESFPLSMCVPLEEFLIHPDATCIEDSPIVGRKTRLRRSDLIQMGYDKEVINKLPALASDYTEEGERDERRQSQYHFDNDQGLEESLQEIEYYDLYVRTDQDEDGIAELRHMCFGGKISDNTILEDEETDDVPFAAITLERRPHQWEGTSIADDTMEIQRIKTVLLRQTLDNIYWQNNPQPIMQDGRVVNPEAVFNPEFGKPIRVKQGTDVREALGFNQVPFVARDSFSMLEYLDAEATDRTGISEASSGMAPDALQNMTATATALIEQGGIGQTEMIVRCVAQGLKAYFRGLLKLTIKHQDKPRTVRLRNKWVEYDPRHWNASMDVTVNTGLGAGTRERDIAVMQQVMAIQERMLAGFGPDNPFIKPENVYNTTKKMLESAGLKTPSLYITEPNPEEVEAKLQALRNAPDPEKAKAEAAMQMEQIKLQAQSQARQQELQQQMQIEQVKMQSNRDKEMAQLEADIQVKQIEIAAASKDKSEQLQADTFKEEQKLAFERERLAQEYELKLLELDQKRESDNARLVADVQKHAALSFGKNMEAAE